MNGVPLLVVAENLGHADTRMVERHYGHLAPSYVADAIRSGAPRFGIKADRKVVALKGSWNSGRSACRWLVAAASQGCYASGQGDLALR